VRWRWHLYQITPLSNAQSDLGVSTTYAGIKGTPGITRKLKEAVIYKD